MNVLELAIFLGFIPAFAMLVCTLVGLGYEVPHNIAGALQHFAAGILICSIGIELLPAMEKASGFAEVFASGVGFFSKRICRASDNFLRANIGVED